jgi:iron complex outermembrane receptor protein
MGETMTSILADKTSVRMAVAAALTTGLMATSVHAADPQPGAVDGRLEEITVTARKRDESLQSVPIAVTAFSASAIESIGMKSLEDVALRTPGVQFSEQAGQIPGRFNCSIRFRGMNVNSEQPVAQLGALFVDGIFVASGCNSLGAEDLQRVEVVKGPQAVYFGRNTFGGAVNYVTKDPGNEWGGKVVASAAEDEDYEFTGSLEGPIVDDKLAFRVAGRYYDRGAVFGESADGTGLGTQKTQSVATKLVFTPTESFTLKLRGQYSEDRDGPPGSGFLSGRLNDTCTGTRGPNGEVRRNYICGMLPDADSARTQNPSGRLFSYNTLLSPASFPTRPQYLLTQLLQNGANDPAIAGALSLDYFGLKRNMTFLGGTADWDLPNGWTLSGVYGYNKMRSNWLRDFDLTEAEAWWSTDPQNLTDHTYELRVTSAQDQRLTWVLGASKYKMEYTQSGNGGTVVTSIAGAGGTRVPLTFNNSLVNNVIQNYEAVFGGLTFKFTDTISASAEARYQKDELEKGQFIAAQLGRAPATAKWSDTLPRLIVQWQPTPETNVYASYSKGVLPGDINAEYIFGPDNMRTAEQVESARTQIRNGAAPYAELPGLAQGSLGVPTASDFIDREELKSYEIGWKQQWLDGRLQTNAAAYFMKWKNQKGRLSVTIVDFNGNTTQPYVKDPASCGAGVRNSADPICNDTIRTLQFAVPGASELKGIELETSFRATERLTLQLNLDYTQNEYTDFTFNFVEPLAGTRDMKGNSSPRYPEWKGNVAASYAGAPIGSGNWTWFARGDLLYFGKYFVDESNLATAPAQTLLSARAGVTNGSIRVELFGDNLTDEDAYASASRWSDFTTPAVASTANQGIAVAPQRSRYFGVRASYEF